MEIVQNNCQLYQISKWLTSKTYFSGASIFLTPNNMGVDTKIMFLSVPEVRLCQLVGFSFAGGHFEIGLK